jgi:hypothetical protein
VQQLQKEIAALKAAAVKVVAANDGDDAAMDDGSDAEAVDGSAADRIGWQRKLVDILLLQHPAGSSGHSRAAEAKAELDSMRAKQREAIPPHMRTRDADRLVLRRAKALEAAGATVEATLVAAVAAQAAHALAQTELVAARGRHRDAVDERAKLHVLAADLGNSVCTSQWVQDATLSAVAASFHDSPEVAAATAAYQAVILSAVEARATAAAAAAVVAKEVAPVAAAPAAKADGQPPPKRQRSVQDEADAAQHLTDTAFLSAEPTAEAATQEGIALLGQVRARVRAYQAAASAKPL